MAYTKVLRKKTPSRPPKFKIGDSVQTKTGWVFQIDKIHKPTPDLHEEGWQYYDVGGCGTEESNLQLSNVA
ncbi:MAG: hypothetical protein Q7R33_00730 [Nitrosarchaeum sp.]|nr:hypothetical protein [Nitrosarchaeum sp.]